MIRNSRKFRGVRKAFSLRKVEPVARDATLGRERGDNWLNAEFRRNRDEAFWCPYAERRPSIPARRAKERRMARGILRAFGKFSGWQARGALLAAALSLGLSASVGWAAEGETGRGAGEGGGNEPALRASSSEARAERYVEAVSAYLRQFSGRVLGGLSMTGSVTAADLGDAAEILLPGVAVAGGRIRLGDVAARVRPLEEARYDVDFSWDGRAGIYANGARTGAVDVAAPRLKGQWDSDLKAFARFDVETGPLVWTRGDESVLSAKALSVNRKLLPNGKSGWGEDSILRVAGLDLDGWEGNAYARIGDARIEFHRTSFDPAAWLFLSDAVGISRASGKTNETAAALARAPEGHGAARFADVEIAGDDGMRLALAELALRVDYREKSGNFFVDIGAPRLPGTSFRFLSGRVAAEIEILGFPLGRFFAEMGDKRFWRAHGRKAPLEAGRRFWSRAGRDSEFRISSFKVGLPPAEANVHGALRPDGAGGAVGEFRARITGVDDFLRTLPKSQLPVPAMVIALLKGLGRPVAGKDGRIAYVYHIDLSVDGAITVNGMSLSPPAE